LLRCSQIEKRYGRDAEALLSQLVTKIFLKTSELCTEKWTSDVIGEIEDERWKESRTMQMLGPKTSYAMEIATVHALMASEMPELMPPHGTSPGESVRVGGL
jgi:type IV secretory pathway TraG/TraD family ATPase VirD4